MPNSKSWLGATDSKSSDIPAHPKKTALSLSAVFALIFDLLRSTSVSVCNYVKPELLIAGVYTSLRFSFVFFGAHECYRDVMPMNHGHLRVVQMPARYVPGSLPKT